MYNKKELMEKHKSYIVEKYKDPRITLNTIAEHIGVNLSTVSRYARLWGLSKVEFRNRKMTNEKIEWLKENYNLPYKELREYTGCCDEVIRQELLRLGIKRTTKYRPFKVDMNDKEFISDLKNPRLTSVDIEEKYKNKYGVGQSRIQQLRKKYGIKLQLDFKHRLSTPEKVVKQILEDLDLAYILEKQVGKYHIDFYLGKKTCIEVQGSYWHSLPKRKITDKRKREFLESKGYKIIYINEEEIENAKKDIINKLTKLGFPI